MSPENPKCPVVAGSTAGGWPIDAIIIQGRSTRELREAKKWMQNIPVTVTKHLQLDYESLIDIEFDNQISLSMPNAYAVQGSELLESITPSSFYGL